MDLSESMKTILAKQQSAAAAGVGSINLHLNPGGVSGGSRQKTSAAIEGTPGVGYVTEKLYMLLQLYLQNKGWSPSAELLQCFAELKDSPLLPNAAYLQVLASRLALDGQGRLVLRDNGKIVLPFEHFANAVMLKHMSGPHGLHLSLEATMRAVIESYTIGRDNFGMEKEFIVEVVNSCPNPACRYYKSHLNPFDGATAGQQHASGSAGTPAVGGASGTSSSVAPNLSLEMATDLAKSSQLLKQQQQLGHHSQVQQAQQQQLKGQQQQQQHHLTNVLMQQNRALAAQQSLEKFNNLSAIEKQRMLAAAMCPPNTGQPNNGNPLSNLMNNSPTNNPLLPPNLTNNMLPGVVVGPSSSLPSPATVGGNNSQAAVAAAAINAMKQQLTANNLANQQQQQQGNNSNNSNLTANPNLNLLGAGGGQSASGSANNQSQHGYIQGSNPAANLLNPLEAQAHKISEYMRNAESCMTPSGSGSSTPNLESMASNKDNLLALHNGAWANNGGSANNHQASAGSLAEYRDGVFVGQDKIVRVFSELMRNMAKMKSFIRPAMCKPYGKQSESLQKSLLDTIQLVQSLRNCLPASHIPVNSWKSEDRQFREVGGNFEGC